MVWYGMVWYGMVWYGKVWYGIAQCGVVSYVFSNSCFPVSRSRGVRDTF